jgi:hypothetical protein
MESEIYKINNMDVRFKAEIEMILIKIMLVKEYKMILINIYI